MHRQGSSRRCWLIGIGFTIGNSLGGKLADRSIDKTLIGFLLLEAATMIAFPWLAQTQLGAAAACWCGGSLPLRWCRRCRCA
jgi:predicted MFS family arabinose efflux permease